jgi:glycosyltransferase involved in cell wall biosynthesis
MDKGKKILFLITQSEFGGAQRFIYTFINGLHGYEIAVGAGPDGDDEKGLLSAIQKKGINTKHLKYLRRSINPFFDFLGIIEICRLIKKEKPDVLFLCSTKAGILGSLAGRILKLPKIIYRIGGWTFNDPWPNWRKKMYIWFEKYTAGFKDFIINNAESDRQQAIKLGIGPRKKIITISNGIDIDGLKFLPKEEARKAVSDFSAIGSISANQQLICTVAHLYPAKGLEYLIEAANLLEEKSIKFVIMGEGKERESLEKLIKRYNLEKNVFLTGNVPEAYKYLKAFDIFVSPSVKEGSPWVVLEAMAAEIPIIATKVGAVPNIIENNKNGFMVEPRDSRAIADSIEKLLSDEKLGLRFTEEAKTTVIEKFSLNKMIGEIEKLF